MRAAGQAKAHSARATTAGTRSITAIVRRAGEAVDMVPLPWTVSGASKRRIVRFRFSTVPSGVPVVKKECSF
ncbi:hypothetical protein SSP531S_06250 [Streptomyces spongiicola]|uniref:Uncharacterized protein n=1 Tax=Streptomyces spongiicola TaxID=1690221 RepID=A0A388STX0_9ACTN|nr:hypothetical protein SSP531S_06250 [Streptomyces spongiicola]